MVVATILDLLAKLIPVWITLLVFAFGYLIYLFKKASDNFIALAEKQSKYMKERVDVVDKSTQILSRTLDQEEKEIERLNKRLKEATTHFSESNIAQTQLSAQEISTLTSTIEDLSKTQKSLIEFVTSLHTEEDKIKELSKLHTKVEDGITKRLPETIRSRNLSSYPIEFINFKGGQNMVEELSKKGYFIEPCIEEEKIRRESEHESIWLGKRVPSKIAVEVILIAKKHYPFLKYISISGDYEEPPDYIHSEIYIGGSTEISVEIDQVRAWSKSDFKKLRADMSLEELHKYVRSFYTKIYSVSSPDNNN